MNKLHVYPNNNLSKFWQLDGNVTTIIPSNSDMNSYITPGNYRCVSNASLATLSNCPVDNAFSLKVSTPIGSPNYIVQEYIDLAGRQAIRAYSAYEKTWTEKKSVVKDDLENLFRNDGFYFTYSKADDFTNILEELNVTDAVYIARKANAAVFGREMTSGGKYYGSQLKIDHNTGLTFRKWAGVSKGNFGDWITK